MIAGRAHRSGLLALLLVTVVWGTTFPAMKQLSADLAALEIIWLRFGLSSLLLLPGLRGLRRNEWRWGLLIGLALFGAFYLQVSGLALTTSNRNAFVTGLNVLIVPLLALLLGQRLGWPLLVGALMGVLGLYGLFYEQAPWSLGDSLTLASAFVYAVYVLLFEVSARHAHTPLRPERLALVQSLLMFALSSLGLALLMPQAWATLAARAQPHAANLLYLGIVASALMVWLQAWGQQRVRAVEAAILYGLEPAVAALAAVWWIGETLTGRAVGGGLLIVLGVLVSQIPPRRRHVPN